MAHHDRHRRVGWERQLSGHALKRHHSQRVDVGAGVDDAIGHALLRRHVLRGADVGASAGEGPIRLQQGGDAEVGEQEMIFGSQQHIGGLDVPVDDAVAVRALERQGGLRQQSPESKLGQAGRAARSAGAIRLRRVPPLMYSMTIKAQPLSSP